MGHSKPTGTLVLRWALYIALLLFAAVLQTTPLIVGIIKTWPIFILPVCLGVALYEGEFAGALFGMAGGLLWDIASGRVAGFFALQLLLLCFFASILWKLYLQNTMLTFMLITAISSFFVLTLDFLVFYFLHHYPAPSMRFLLFVLPEVAITTAIGLPFWWLTKKINAISLETKTNKK